MNMVNEMEQTCAARQEWIGGAAFLCGMPNAAAGNDEARYYFVVQRAP